MLGRKENKNHVLKISKIFSLQAINQTFCLIYLHNKKDMSKVRIGKISCYLEI